jgi:hypothetical protein
VYLATHFHNWYHLASHAETARYCEDLALWGINDVMVAFPMINLEGWDDPEADPAVTMVLRYARAARDVGLSFTTGVNNPLFRGAPGFWRRRCTGVSPTGAGRAGDESWCSCGRCPTGNASPAVAWARSRPRPPWAGWPSSITARWRPTIRTTTAFGRR